MRRILLAFAFLLSFLSVQANAQNAAVSLTAISNLGNPVPNGVLTFTLMNCGKTITPNPTAVLTANSSGFVSGAVPQSNSTAFSCIGSVSYYIVTLTNASGRLLWTRPYQITTATTSLSSALTTLPATIQPGDVPSSGGTGGGPSLSFSAPAVNWPSFLVPVVSSSGTLSVTFGLLPIAYGGTGATSATGALGNLFAGITGCGTLGNTYFPASGACLPSGTGSGGSSVSINGIGVSSPNFNAAIPTAPAYSANVRFQTDGTNVSGNVPSFFNADNSNQVFYGDSELVVSSSCLVSSATNSEAAITSGSVSGGVLTAQVTNSQVSGNYVTLSAFGGSYAALNGQIVQLLSTGLSGSQFEANVTGVSNGSTGAGRYSCSYSAPTQASRMAAFAGHGTVYNLAIGGTTTTDLAADYATVVHPYSPAVTSQPGTMYTMMGQNDLLGSGCSLATMQTNAQNLWAAAHTDGLRVVQILEPVLTTSNIYCPTAQTIAVQWHNWLIAQSKAAVPSQPTGAYWDGMVDPSQAMANTADSNLYITTGGDAGHFTDAGAFIVAAVVNEAVSQQGTVSAPAVQNQVGTSSNFALLQNQNGAVVGNGYAWSNGTGPGLVAIGVDDWPDYTDGDNVLLGNYAMRGAGASQSGNSGNVMVGNYTFYNTGGSGNQNTHMTVVGEKVGYANNGSNNSNCEMFGYAISFNLSHCVNAILIGHDLGYPGDNVIQLGDSSNTALVIPAVRSAAGTVPLQVDTGGNITPGAAQAPQFKQYAYATEDGTNVTSATSNSITVASGDFVFVICKNMTGTVTDTLGSTWHALANLSTTAVTSSAAWAVLGSSGSDAFTCTMTTGTTSSTSVLAVDYAGTLGTINASTTNTSSSTITNFFSNGVTTTGRSLVLFCTAVSSNNSEFTPGYLAGYPAVLRGQSQSGLALGSDSGCADAAVSTAVPNWLASMSYGTAQYWTGYVLAVNY